MGSLGMGMQICKGMVCDSVDDSAEATRTKACYK